MIKLEELSPYLSYELKVRYCCVYDADNDYDVTLKIVGNRDDSELIYEMTNRDSSYFPVLKPLHNFVNIDEITDKMTKFEYENLKYMMEEGSYHHEQLQMNWQVMNLMFKHHLDVFGLIDRRLAINADK